MEERFSDEKIVELGRRVVHMEMVALQDAEQRMNHSFAKAISVLVECVGKVVCSGMGKAGLIAQKVAATFASTGIAALFLHPAEAMHGDLGMVGLGDVALLFSNSGESEEVIKLQPYLRSRGVYQIAITAKEQSSIGVNADLVLEIGEVEEACPLQLAPSSSTTTLLAIGDALALVTLEVRGFTTEEYARLHPGGSLGRQMSRVEELMRTGERCPLADSNTEVRVVVNAITRARSGLACIVDSEKRLLGVFTDGDFRRRWEEDSEIGSRAVGEVMTRSCRYIKKGLLVREAKKLMSDCHINALPIVDHGKIVIGILDLQDIV
ncbi:MAG: KpsF/GutQ family sugar-phosphate isomerase [Blastocatellia bacterium]|nr:KpsF/GutQ family sugar-phosphate isomerase [Blastocatellia bacterium]